MSKIDILHKLGIGRRQPSDPFFAEGDAVCKADKREGIVEIDEEDLCHEIVAKFPCHVFGCTLEFDSVLQYELHYNSSHRYHCSECRKRLPSPHLLDLHISETHDSFFLAQAQRKPMYRCYVEECNSMFTTPQERRGHCIGNHQFPHDFRFDGARKQKTKHCKLKHSNDGLAECEMEVDPSQGDNKCEMWPKSKPRTVVVLPQSFKVFGSGNVEKCNQRYEEGTLVGETTSTHLEGRDMHTEGFVKPFSFGRGRGKHQRLRLYKNFNPGLNKGEQTLSSNPNAWGTSDLLDALQDTKGGKNDEFACASDALGDTKNNPDEQISCLQGALENVKDDLRCQGSRDEC